MCPARMRPSGSPPSESRNVPGARNVLGPEQLIVQLKNVLIPAPEMFAKFAKFAKFATFVHSTRYRRRSCTVESRARLIEDTAAPGSSEVQHL
jgi:hypothetical protein